MVCCKCNFHIQVMSVAPTSTSCQNEKYEDNFDASWCHSNSSRRLLGSKQPRRSFYSFHRQQENSPKRQKVRHLGLTQLDRSVSSQDRELCAGLSKFNPIIIADSTDDYCCGPLGQVNRKLFVNTCLRHRYSISTADLSIVQDPLLNLPFSDSLIIFGLHLILKKLNLLNCTYLKDPLTRLDTIFHRRNKCCIDFPIALLPYFDETKQHFAIFLLFHGNRLVMHESDPLVRRKAILCSVDSFWHVSNPSKERSQTILS